MRPIRHEEAPGITLTDQNNLASPLEDARRVLAAVWGYDTFRPTQEVALTQILAGRDTLAVLPTGGGKSLLYQIPALMRDGLTVVVSPLIALMEDQALRLKAQRVRAAVINSTMSFRAVEQTLNDACFGKYRLMYLAPERLETELFQAFAPKLNVTLLAVDEAHCVSAWGRHFRPSYLKIAEARLALGDPQMIAVTATATPEVRRDLLELLGLRDPSVVVKGFDRPNLTWSIRITNNKRQQLRRVLEGVPGCGIVYAATRRSTEEWHAWLTRQGVPSAFYHGGLDGKARQAALASWLRDEVRVMVATNAFGMGIDKPDVRFVVHVEVPGSLEDYYQEAGRCGRDGEVAHAVLLYQPRDLETQRALIANSHPTSKQLATIFDALCNLAQVPVGEKKEGPVWVDVNKVGALAECPPALVRTAIDMLERAEAVRLLALREEEGLLGFTSTVEGLREWASAQGKAALQQFVQGLMRHVPAEAFHRQVVISIRRLARALKLEEARLRRGLSFLSERGFIAWQPSGARIALEMLIARTRRLSLQRDTTGEARRAAETRLVAMHRYATSVTCRRQFLLAYFGEGTASRCGRCDACRAHLKPTTVTPVDEPAIMELLHHAHGGKPQVEWETSLPPDQLSRLLQWLLGEELIRVEDGLLQTYALTERGQRKIACLG